jgi:uridine kinase
MTDKEMRLIWAMVRDLVNHEYTLRNFYERLQEMVK